MKIRYATIKDAEMLTELSYKTFFDAFHSHPKNAPEDIADYMEKAFDLKTISAELLEEDSIFLIAELEDEAVGYAKVMVGSIEDEINASRPIELNRLYAKQEFIGKGIGRKLLDECVRIAVENDCDVMWLGVWEYNLRAKRFYEKSGFYEVGRHFFQLGSDRQIDLLMQKDLHCKNGF
jgi:ribosomal protein S18 acetylase RimI-like enzyme